MARADASLPGRARTGLKDTIRARIGALSKVHALFVQSRWEGAHLSSIAEQELAPYLQEGEVRAS
jgi:two-component sensor histidine kinase